MISGIGLGCWQFSHGEGIGGRFWPALPQKTVNEIVAAAVAGGINWFDTAEIYGNGSSESMLAKALTSAGKKPEEVVIATKWWPILRTASSIQRTITERLNRLAPFGIDLHQVHHPYSLDSINSEMRAMADLVVGGKIGGVGVSNFSAHQMRVAHKALASRGIPLATNQVRYSLMDRRIEANGVMMAARELGITIIAYSPLAQGILTGKFHKEPRLAHSRPGPRKWFPSFWRSGLERSRALVTAVERIAYANGVAPAQVALNWLIRVHEDDVVAIPGATSVKQAQENTKAMDLELNANEMKELDELSQQYK
jgi:aryl-alcohol dehydrogenase-like predicted oxidoreductase